MPRHLALVAIAILLWTNSGFLCYVDVPWHFAAAAVALVLASGVTVHVMRSVSRALSQVGL